MKRDELIDAIEDVGAMPFVRLRLSRGASLHEIAKEVAVEVFVDDGPTDGGFASEAHKQNWMAATALMRQYLSAMLEHGHFEFEDEAGEGETDLPR